MPAKAQSHERPGASPAPAPDSTQTLNSSFRPVLDTLRIVGTCDAGHNIYEVCATAVAGYDETSQTMKVDLDCFVRRFEMRGKDQIFRPDWLPGKDSVKTHLSHEEAPEAAKEIFQSWTQKIRKAIPGPSAWSDSPAWLPASEANGRRSE
jgi:hypothetical protein